MRMYDIIEKKRDGYGLSKEEIRYAVLGYTKGEIPDYQMSALLMAIYFQGMSEEETLNLTMAMVESGNRLDLSSIPGKKVDKHSTGGVGDKVSLALAPMVAAAGIPVAKMSGRGLGHTGGTIDKLESIPGFSTVLSTEDFLRNVREVGICIVGQTENLAPADKKIYALRDVTATVNSIPLIASSIMSKKIASGADAIVLDVKVGSGAFMETEEDAVRLGQEMVKIGTGAGRETIAVLSDMDQPLGENIGNSIEVLEAMEALRGEGPEDFMELCYALGSHMLVLGGVCENAEQAAGKLKEIVQSGKAVEKMKEFIAAQGGDPSCVEDAGKFEQAAYQYEIKAPEDGFVEHIRCRDIGKASLALGGGRETKDSEINLKTGIKIRKKVGDQVKEGETIAVIYSDDSGEQKDEAIRLVTGAYQFSRLPVSKKPLIKWVITGNGIRKY